MSPRIRREMSQEVESEAGGCQVQEIGGGYEHQVQEPGGEHQVQELGGQGTSWWHPRGGRGDRTRQLAGLRVNEA